MVAGSSSATTLDSKPLPLWETAAKRAPLAVKLSVVSSISETRTSLSPLCVDPGVIVKLMKRSGSYSLENSFWNAGQLPSDCAATGVDCQRSPTVKPPCAVLATSGVSPLAPAPGTKLVRSSGAS